MLNQTEPLNRPATASGESVIATIAARTRENRGSVALVSSSAAITYGELEDRSNQLARHLLSLGAGSSRPVALCLERSPDFVIAALAVLKCGAAYLPLDPAYPAERLLFVARDAGISLLLTTSTLAKHFTGANLQIVDVPGSRETVEAMSNLPVNVNVDPHALAYIIYTSGSTGQPKGVEVTHGNLSNLVCWHLRAFSLRPTDRGTFQAGVGFDAAVWEIWPVLSVGAALFIPDEATRFSPELYQEWLIQRRITTSFVPTAMAEQLISRPWPADTALRILLTGADTLHRHPPQGLPFTLVNNYGPTECTVVATSAAIGPAAQAGGLPSIGRPIDNVVIRIVDESLKDVAPGITGELLIGGAGVARGYRNRPEMTAERFLPDTSRGNGARWYRTGDLVRSLESGEIEFLGRADDQVKIRGYRIELNEINAALNEHPCVGASFVMAREDVPGDKRLVAYLAPKAGVDPDEAGVRQLLRRRLPDYMEPGAMIWLDALPLTSNGKVDRTALPSPTHDGAADTPYVAPRTAIEESIGEIIAEVLSKDRVSVDADFFALGAHSLLGAQIIARIRTAFGIELKLLDVFDAPTVEELAVKVEEALTVQLNAMSEEEVEAALAAQGSSAASPSR